MAGRGIRDSLDEFIRGRGGLAKNKTTRRAAPETPSAPPPSGPNKSRESARAIRAEQNQPEGVALRTEAAPAERYTPTLQSVSGNVPPAIHGVSAYHARLFAHEVTRMAPAGGVGRVSQSLFDARVDLQPHQVEAGVFALRSPLSKGVILADEVGLGKTIEAGLVLCQFWAERKRRLLVICPASIRKQWQLELSGKFSLPGIVLDGKEYQTLRKQGYGNPFQQDASVVIVSYLYASKCKDDLAKVPWDLVVIDEAHRLRNAKTQAATNLRESLKSCRKILLTATPLQNRLDELHSLATFVDEHAFGDRESFKAQFGGPDADFEQLRHRLKPLLWRTLRRDVKEYIPYTKRFPITVPFDPSQPENWLHEEVSKFLQRGDTYSLPRGQYQLMVLMLRKILASSSSALASTLEKIRGRLQGKLDGKETDKNLIESLLEDEVIDEDEAEEFEDDAPVEEQPVDPVKLKAEIGELSEFIRVARGITVDSKSQALITGLSKGFEEMAKLGAARKALVFTESRRTQDYLKKYLESNGYAGEVVLFNGQPNDPESRKIYDAWLKVNEPLGRSSGSRNIDQRTALIEHFRDSAAIMIATEAGGEGVNLQFCSLIINYDLPWNPQRIEQRIGRCHRYGQLYDVAVVNFLNSENEADRRVLELLTEKFHLFKGVFGSSDEVLGTVESGIDFEKKVLEIYQRCRNRRDIEREFAGLQEEMAESIKRRFVDVRQKLLENFDTEVQQRFRNSFAEAQQRLGRIEDMFWRTTKYVLADAAKFTDSTHEFRLNKSPAANIRAGPYQLIQRSKSGQLEAEGDDILYRISHPLGEYVLQTAKAMGLGVAKVEFKLTGHQGKITVLEKLKGQSGWLTATKLHVKSFGAEEHILLSALTEKGDPVDAETADKLFQLPSPRVTPATIPEPIATRLGMNAQLAVEAQVTAVMETNRKFFEEEQGRLEEWSEDRKTSAKKTEEEIDALLDDIVRQMRRETDFQRKVELKQKEANLLDRQRKARQAYFEALDAIRAETGTFIEAMRLKMTKEATVENLFTIQWSVM